jgi:threonine aldolase
MLQSVLNTPVGDDVLSEDPTVLRLQEYTADLFGKECALFVPTGTMGNLVSIIAHCYRERAAEIIIGSNSHICLWEGGNASNLASVHTRQIEEEANGTLNLSTLSNYIRPNHIDDDHLPKTTMIALENSHNMMGGSVFSYDYIDAVGELVAARSNISSSSSSDGGSNLIKVHLDGARIGNASVALGVDFKRLCQNVDSISICLSKGLGAPLGSVVVGSKEFIQLAKRARKRLGGGMRQVGVVACMGLYALEHNIPRLVEDHERAKRIGKTLYNAGFIQPQNGDVDTNIVYFGLPNSSCLNDATHAMEEEEENNNKKKKSKEEICSRLWKEYGVKIGSGYSSNNGGELFRMVTHLNVNDDDVDRALEAILKVCLD